MYISLIYWFDHSKVGSRQKEWYTCMSKFQNKSLSASQGVPQLANLAIQLIFMLLFDTMICIMNNAALYHCKTKGHQDCANMQAYIYSFANRMLISLHNCILITIFIVPCLNSMSCVMRKPAFCICENKRRRSAEQ